MDPQSVQEVLLKLHAFEPLAPQLRAKVTGLIAACGSVVSLNDGDILVHEGDVGGGAGFVLLSGAVNVSHEGGAPIAVAAPALLGEMHQFNPRAQRTATLAAAVPCEVLKFKWFDFQFRATAELSKEEQGALMDAMERLVWERFQHESIFNVPAFGTLDERSRLRLCLTIVWLARDLHLPAGATLFQQHDLHGGVGYILLDGEIAFFRAGQPFGLMRPPALIGAATDLDPRRAWTASAVARTDANLLRFDWPELEAYLYQRLGVSETEAAFEAIAKSGAGGFVY